MTRALERRGRFGLCAWAALLALPCIAPAYAQAPEEAVPVAAAGTGTETGTETGTGTGTESESESESGEDVSFWDNSLVLPVVFYTPETQLGGGVSGVATFTGLGNGPEDRASNVLVAAIYTMREQMVLVVRPVVWMLGDLHAVEGDIFFQIFPVQYFGVGNDTRRSDREWYTLQSANVGIKYIWRVHSHFYAGLATHTRLGDTLDLEPGGILDTERPTGTGADTISGVGPTLSWDSRDNVLWPTRGTYQQATLTFYRSYFGSDHSVTKLLVDERAYINVVSDHVLALQARMEINDGDVPFYALALTGGSELHRGYPEGRYRDRQLYALQVEYRMPLWWRFGAVAFTSAAQVADHMSKLHPKRFRPAAGLGLRFNVAETEMLNVRVDVAMGSDFSLYINAKEAF